MVVKTEIRSSGEALGGVNDLIERKGGEDDEKGEDLSNWSWNSVLD